MDIKVYNKVNNYPVEESVRLICDLIIPPEFQEGLSLSVKVLHRTPNGGFPAHCSFLYDQLKIDIKISGKLTPRQFCYTLSHELAHAAQFCTYELLATREVRDKMLWIWRGEQYYINTEDDSYHYSPWEIDAEEKELLCGVILENSPMWEDFLNEND